MKKTDILIIGAGASGLMAAYKLSLAGKTVTVLEARNRTGGRIHTLNNELFFQHAELGAEFIHGNLPTTLELLHEAGLTYHVAGGEMWQYHQGKFEKEEQFIEGWDELLGKLKELKKDMPIHSFLQQYFAGEKYELLRKSTERYVAGYDTADTKTASALALSNEWQNEDEDAQYRLDQGYCAMIKFMADTCKSAGNNIILNSVVNTIKWEDDQVTAITAEGIAYEAKKIIIALPLGILKAKDVPAAINFEPALPAYQSAIDNMGFGAIIKTLLEFDNAFWEDNDITSRVGSSLEKMGFLFTDEVIPTWWTQAPKHSPLLTGWLGGPAAFDKKDMSDEDILQLALTSLSHVFKIAPDVLKSKLIAWNIANWTAAPYTLGSYAYDTVESAEARKTLFQPVNGTIYFAGEYLYEGAAMGTVEAALTSGRDVAKKLISG